MLGRLDRVCGSKFKTFVHLALIFGITASLMSFAGKQAAGIFESGRYKLQVASLSDDQLNNMTYVLSGVDFNEVRAVVMQLRADRPCAMSVIPDYRPMDFTEARASTMAGIPGGIYRFAQGAPTLVSPIEQVAENKLRFRAVFGKGEFERPQIDLSLVGRPPAKDLDSILESLVMEFDDGSSMPIDLHPGLPLRLAIPISILLTIIVCLIDLRVLKRLASPLSRKIGASRIRRTRVAGLALTLLLTNITAGMFSSPGTAAYPVYVGLTIVFVLAGLFGGYLFAGRLKPGKARRSRTNLVFATALVLFLVAPFLINGMFHKSRQRTRVNDFIAKRLYHNRIVERRQKDQRIVLCLGGSGTEGIPFLPQWPYDYPQQL